MPDEARALSEQAPDRYQTVQVGDLRNLEYVVLLTLNSLLMVWGMFKTNWKMPVEKMRPEP